MTRDPVFARLAAWPVSAVPGPRLRSSRGLRTSP